MFLLFEMVLSLDIAGMATAILILISFVEVPSIFERVYFFKVLTFHRDVNGGVLVGTVDKYFAFAFSSILKVKS